MRKEPNKIVPRWVSVLFGIVMALGVAIICYLGLWQTAFSHETRFALFELNWPEIRHAKVCFGVSAVLMAVSIFWFVGWYEKPGRRWRRAFWTTVGATVLVWLVTDTCCRIYAGLLTEQGIGTMQTALDTEYHQEEMKLMGNLGIYGGQMKLDGEAQIYLCRQIDTFGPFAEQILADTETQSFSSGYEEYSRFEQDGLVQFHAVSVYHCQDGYWLVVKRFVDICDLHIELESLDDLQRYIVQMQYSRHTGPETYIAQEFEEIAGDAVFRR